KLGMPPAKLGLVYSHTGLRRFIDAIGAARTRELFLLGSYIDAATALQWGLVTRVAAAEQLEAATLALAAELAGNAPLSQTGNKRVIAALLAAESELPAEVEQELIELRRASFASEDMREGMRAFAERRQLLRGGLERTAESVELGEELVEARRGDDLQHPAGLLAGVPEGVPLAARLEHELAAPRLDHLVAEQRAHPPLEHEAVLVLTRVPVQRRRERVRGHRVFDHREALLG